MADSRTGLSLAGAMLPVILLLLVLMAQASLLHVLIVDGQGLEPLTWLAKHTSLSLLLGLACAALVRQRVAGSVTAVFWLTVLFSLLMPLAGALGAVFALVPAMMRTAADHADTRWWQVTDPVALPYTSPTGRSTRYPEQRNFIEQLDFSTDDEALYRKVLAAGSMRTSLSVGVLKRAINHTDERIRLTASQSLDRCADHLNRRIQHLETAVDSLMDDDRYTRWMQIAGLYRELLTLEEDEPVAREQLLDKLEFAIGQAAAIRPDERRVQFLLGQLWLQRGRSVAAIKAFERASALGMPRQSVLPYQAEAAFRQRDFAAVSDELSSLGDSLRHYPPVQQVASYWA